MFEPLWLTLKVAILATMLAGATGIGLGWWMSRRRFAGHALVDAFLMMPLVLPPSMLGVSLLLLMGPQGPFGPGTDALGLARLPLTFCGLVMV